MKAQRTVDDLGRIVIPTEIRKNLGLKGGSECLVSLTGNVIHIEPCEKTCALCGKTAAIEVLPHKHICTACAAKIAKKA